MRPFFAVGLLAFATPVFAQGTAETQVTQLIKNFGKAEQAYDAGALSQLISDRFIEVSPAGEIDGHDRFLSFYAADKKVPWPKFTTREEPIRVFRDTAIDIVTFHYDMPGPNGSTRSMEIRSTFVAQRADGIWKLIQVQHTGIRPAPAGQ